MKFYRITGKSTSEFYIIDESVKYDYLAIKIINNDTNGIGDGEIRFVDAQQLRIPIQINGWIMDSSIYMNYGWGSSTLTLNITDSKGKTNQITLEEAVGCRSSYWGVSIVNRIIGKFRSIAANSDWQSYDKAAYIALLQDQINQLLLNKEEINRALIRLRNELTLLM